MPKYHFYASKQVAPGRVIHLDGIADMQQPVVTLADYAALKQCIADGPGQGIGADQLTICSLTLLPEPVCELPPALVGLEPNPELVEAIQRAQAIADQAGASPAGTESRQIAAWLRRLVRMEHDFPYLSEFHRKHALGPMLPPKCLICGQSTAPAELEAPFSVAIRHNDLPGVVVCKHCADAARAAQVANCADVADVAKGSSK